MTTTNYEAAETYAVNAEKLVVEGTPMHPNELRLQAAQVRATLAVADELRALKEVLEGTIGYLGPTGPAFIRVFDEAP